MPELLALEKFVKEAFIFPLRSVLIVDDQYPTWEEIFNGNIVGEEHSEVLAVKGENKRWNQSDTSLEIQRLIKEFRAQKPGFVIDIHDGVIAQANDAGLQVETPVELASHLHQSDLLVLDYNLEGPEVGTGGDLARRILSSVLENKHFNLVVVHTSEDLDRAVYECLRSLMPSCTSVLGKELNAQLDLLDENILEKELEEEFDRSLINEKLDMATYMMARDPDNGVAKALKSFMGGQGAFVALSEWCDSIGLKGGQKKHFFYWAIRLFERPLLDDFADSSPRGLCWKISEGSRWIRTSRGFVCFVRKGPENILSELTRALVDWRPTPSTLLSAKYRDAVNKQGVEAEDTSLMRQHAFAKFYQTILYPAHEGATPEQIASFRKYNLKAHVSRQSEMMSFLVEGDVIDFGVRIVDADAATGFKFKEYYMVDLDSSKDNEIAIAQYNRHVCSLPSKRDIGGHPESEQLDSGHIFRFDDSWWVCATPACDLQPGQNVIGFKKGGDSNLRPFMALQLVQVQDLNLLTSDHINSGAYCYVEDEGNVIALGLKHPNEDTRQPAVQKVKWQAFIAKQGGLIVGGRLEFLEVKLDLNDELSVVSSHLEAEVVAKLRYEYALNYIQRVGTSVSRIGLGYVSPPRQQ